MASHRTLLAALLGCILLAGCNGSDNTADTGDTSGTFAECQTGTLVDGKCVVTPAVITSECQQGTLVDGQCIVTPNVVTKECETGNLEGSECVVTPIVTVKECETGTLVDGKCVITLDVVIKECPAGSLLTDGQCVANVAPPATDPTNLDDGLDRISWRSESATITAGPATRAQRGYSLTTTQDQRKSGKGKQLAINEHADAPTIRTGSQMFDGLFALAIQEARDLTVTSIRDSKYKNGAAIPCGGTVGCFQTGDSWTYVWTRDTSYAIDLGLAQINPQVAKNSLLFKISTHRNTTGPGANTTEIVQDTGSGGSWPISTDRVVWARAAFELLKYLDGNDRTKLVNDAYTAIRNTIESDRLVAYDSRDGLYRGETSFLDWRQQTYPSWMDPNVVHIAMSKTLSTNINHWKILDVAANMAVELNVADAAKYAVWASDLKGRIKSDLWLQDPGLFSMMKSTELDQAPVRRYELLGEALAIQDGIADEAQATSILQNYPHTEAGAAVVWPQMRGVRVYHNRSIWPFVSSYLIKAAKGQNADVVNRNFDTLMNGAALNLSNMENFEFTTLDYRGRKITVKVNLPDAGLSTDGFYTVQAVTLNGARIPLDSFTKATDLRSDGPNIFVVGLINSTADGGSATVVSGDTQLYGPDSVALNLASERWALTKDSNRLININWNGPNPAGTTINIYRNGVLIATGVTATNWRDSTSNTITDRALCYSLERQYTGGLTNVSQRTNPACYWGEDVDSSGLGDRLVVLDAGNATNRRVTDSKTELKNDHGRNSWSDWGMPGEELTFTFTAPATGDYDILLQYANGFGGNTGGGNTIQTGVTAVVKRVDVTGPSLTATSVLAMPQRTNWDDWGESTPIHVRLVQGGNYRLRISDYYNMSYLTTNVDLNGDGGSQILNRANISGIMLRRQSD